MRTRDGHEIGKLYIIGAGGHGVVIAEIASLMGCKIAGFIDDNQDLAGTEVLEWTVLGGRECIPDGAMVAFGIGDNDNRGRMMNEPQTRRWILPILVHPSAIISPSATLGPGTVVMAQAVVNARTQIGRGCILNTACSVDHDCNIGEMVHIAPGVRIGGGVTVGESTLLGVGCSVRPWLTVGSRCTIGVGSAVVSDVPDGVISFGNPSRVRGNADER